MGCFLGGNDMKRLIVTLLTVLMVFAFCGCKQKSDMFIVVERGLDYTIYQHKDTGVYYLQIENRGLTVMLNADGTPYTGE